MSVELELSNLAVNTLLVASRIPELEGATSLTFDRLSATERPIEEQINQGLNLGANITSYDETAACSAAFRVLRCVSAFFLVLSALKVVSSRDLECSVNRTPDTAH